MLHRKPSIRFIKDIKLAKKRKLSVNKLEEIISMLCSGTKLPRSYKVHPLTGNWSSFWECHIEPDWLLIYRVKNETLELVRTGTHSDIF